MGIETAILGSAVLGAGAGLYGSSKAASAQENAAAQSAAVQREMFNKQVELQAPFREAGLTAQNRLLDYLGLSSNVNAPEYGSLNQSFGMDQFTADPGYAFRLSEGMKGLNAQAAARGGMISGGALKAAQNYGQQAGSQEYQNAFNRYQTERAAKLNPLQSLMGAGQSGANTLTSAAGNLGQGLGQAAVAGGNAQAGNYLNQANTINNALNQGVSAYSQDQYLNNLGTRVPLAPMYGGPGLY
jgi:hypothetical protein